MWRRIFFPLCGCDEEFSALSYAFSCASLFSANIEALLVREDPEEHISALGFYTYGVDEIRHEYIRLFSELGKKEAQSRRRKFGRVCKQLGIPRIKGTHRARIGASAPGAHLSERMGSPGIEIPLFAVGCDVAVFPSGAARQGLIMPSLIEQTLIHSGRPNLVVPEGISKCKTEKVLIAWDGSSEAARAAREALPLLEKAGEVLVVSVEDQDQKSNYHHLLIDYLQAHGIPAKGRILSNDQSSTATVILDAAAAEKADLIVMGAYSRMGPFEVLLGGVTVQSLRYAKAPLLIMH